MMRRSWWLGPALAAVTLSHGPAAAQAAPAYPPDYRLASLPLPVPTGRHPVATRELLVPATGSEPLRVIAWYPAADRTGPLQPYLSAPEQAVQAPAVTRNFGWPSALLERIGATPTHSHIGNPVAHGRFPLVIFSHGFLSYPRQNTALMERLASEGYVVLSLAHPGDAADLPVTGGTLPTTPDSRFPKPDIPRLLAFWNGSDHAARAAAFPGFWEGLRGGRMLASLERWRTDILRLADAFATGRVPIAARDLARATNTRRVAFIGMSFGGSASASACQISRRCAAAVNVDGFEFDQTLYDRTPRMPLLLIQNDWTVFPNMGPASATETIYDYAYRRWNRPDRGSRVARFRMAGVKHLGLTDLVLAPRDPVRDRMFGPAQGSVVASALNDMVTTFLDRHVKGSASDIDAAAARNAGVVRHRPRPTGHQGS